MIVRPARRADIPALAALAAASYRTAFADILQPEALAERDTVFFERRFADVLARMMVATDDERPVGFSLVTATHLDMLFVAAEAQGSGAGRALLTAAEAAGVRSLECFRDNGAARAFYERHGWRIAAAYEREFIGRPCAFVRYEKP